MPEKSEEIIDAESRDVMDSLEQPNTDTDETTSPAIATRVIDYLSSIQLNIDNLLRNNVNVTLSKYDREDAEKISDLIQQAFAIIQNIN